MLIHEGDRGDTLFIILAGRLRAYSTNLQQDREIIYGTYGAGEYVGELGLDGGLRSASVMAQEPSICAIVTRTTLQAHLADHPEFGLELLAKVIARARAATLTARRMVLNDAYGCIKLLLESRAGPAATGAWRDVPRMNRIEIAAHAGCHASMVSKVLKELEAGGHIDTRGAVWRLRLPLPARW